MFILFCVLSLVGFMNACLYSDLISNCMCTWRVFDCSYLASKRCPWSRLFNDLAALFLCSVFLSLTEYSGMLNHIVFSKISLCSIPMSKLNFCCNISWLFRENEFTERFQLAADAGFKGQIPNYWLNRLWAYFLTIIPKWSDIALSAWVSIALPMTSKFFVSLNCKLPDEHQSALKYIDVLIKFRNIIFLTCNLCKIYESNLNMIFVY